VRPNKCYGLQIPVEPAGGATLHWLSKELMMRPKREGGLGFRDIYAFNMAMLAKQCWRLWQFPNSLCARVLKAKYFANTSVLEAKPKAGMSYTWRSVLRGLEVMKQGMLWRIGGRHQLENLGRSMVSPRFFKTSYYAEGRMSSHVRCRTDKSHYWIMG